MLKEGLPSSFSFEGVVKLPNCWVTLSSSLSKTVVNNRLKIESLSLQHDDFNGEADRSFPS